LLAGALALTGPERQRWVAAAQGANGRQAEAGLPSAGGLAQPPRRVTIAVLTRDTQDRAGPGIIWLTGGAGQTLLVVHCARTMPAIPFRPQASEMKNEKWHNNRAAEPAHAPVEEGKARCARAFM
jgi:hypothetical protein